MTPADVRALVYVGWVADVNNATRRRARELLYEALPGHEALAAVVKYTIEFNRREHV